MGNCTARGKERTFFLQYLEVPSAPNVMAAVLQAEVGLRKPSHLRLTSHSSCPSRKLAVWPIPCLKYLHQSPFSQLVNDRVRNRKKQVRGVFLSTETISPGVNGV